MWSTNTTEKGGEGGVKKKNLVAAALGADWLQLITIQPGNNASRWRQWRLLIIDELPCEVDNAYKQVTANRGNGWNNPNQNKHCGLSRLLLWFSKWEETFVGL